MSGAVFVCCGATGRTANSSAPESAHFLHHIHKAKAENIEAGIRAERGGEPTDAQASYLEALRYFLKVVNVVNADEYFPTLRQLPLNPEWEERKT